MAKETNIKTDKKTVGGWGAWELQYDMKYPNIVGSTHLLKAIWTLFGLSKKLILR
jgi:hypothetical protein